MVEHAGIVEQAEEEGADDAPGLVPPEAPDDAVRRALVLHLHHGPLVRLVGELAVLDDHAVQPGALEPGEPVPGHFRLAW